MADNRNRGSGVEAGNCFKEAVCIDASRVYDSCADKDCLEDLKVFFTDCTQRIVDSASSIRCRDAEVITCLIDIEEVPFNRGCYSVDLTFFFKIHFEAFSTPAVPPVTICGISVFSKKCILYGSEGNVKIFTSQFQPDDFDDQLMPSNTNPRAKVQCVDPVALAARVCEVHHCCEPCCHLPACVERQFQGSFENVDPEKEVFVTLGLFIIIQLERDVQLLVPAYDFCIPDKECNCDTEDPCDAFRKIRFPVDDFFPPKEHNNCGNCNDFER